MRVPLTLSIAGHTILLALLILFAAETRPPPEPAIKKGIEIVFGQSLSQPQPVLAPEAASQPADPSIIAAVPPPEVSEPEPVVEPATPVPLLSSDQPMAMVESPPIPEVAQTEPAPPVTPTPVIRQQAKPPKRQKQPRAPLPAPVPAQPRLAEAPPAAPAAPQYQGSQSAAAAMPARVPPPDLTGNYRALISAWFETHKHYPNSARQRGEEGSVGLSFRVDRFGRVLDYTLLTRTGYADLDAGIDQMMRGAQLPPFPAGMTASQIEVSVTIRFTLTR